MLKKYTVIHSEWGLLGTYNILDSLERYFCSAFLSLVAIAAKNEKGTPKTFAPPDGEPWLRTRPTTYPGTLSAV